MRAPQWDEDEAMERSTDLLVTCGPRGQSCWALQAVLDEVIGQTGPWWLANFLENARNPEVAQAFRGYLRDHWPAEADEVDRLIRAGHWSRESEDLTHDFGDA